MKLCSLQPAMLSILRIVSAFMFIPSGTMKIFNFPVGMPAGVPPPQPFDQVWLGGWLEIIGGTLMLLGLFTRPTAFILSGMMAVAYWQFHAIPSLAMPGGFWPTVNQGLPAALYCFIFLYFTTAGAGPWSLDHLTTRKHDHDPA